MKSHEYKRLHSLKGVLVNNFPLCEFANVTYKHGSLIEAIPRREVASNVSSLEMFSYIYTNLIRLGFINNSDAELEVINDVLKLYLSNQKVRMFHNRNES